jgi:hypothetical protein
MHFLRHGKKEKEPKDNDLEIRLTPEGKLQALCRAIELKDRKHMLAKGSPRKRTQETSGIIALAEELMAELKINKEELLQLENKILNKEELTPEEENLLQRLDEMTTLENLENRYNDLFNTINSEMHWIDQDADLNFNADGAMGKEMKTAYKEGKLMEYIVYKSDQRAIDLHDKISSSYSRSAGGIAKIVLDYASIAPELNITVNKESKIYKPVKKDGQYIFERVLGTHASVGESFILKVLEILEREKRIPQGTQKDILSKIPAGLKETEGFDIEITQSKTDNSAPIIKLILPQRLQASHLKDIQISIDMLKKIINEAKSV